MSQQIIDSIIKKYEKKKDFRRLPVENFLGTLRGSTRWEAVANLHQDAQCYRWKPSIVSAIKEGINKILSN